MVNEKWKKAEGREERRGAPVEAEQQQPNNAERGESKLPGSNAAALIKGAGRRTSHLADYQSLYNKGLLPAPGARGENHTDGIGFLIVS